jgi:preprotein translocase subunit Sec61beta
MRAILSLLVLMMAEGAPVLHAQVDYNARLGVTWATALLRDAVINEIEVRQKLAPTLVLGAALPIAPLYRAGIELALATSGYQSEEAGAANVDLGTLRTTSITLGLDGPITPRLRWRAGAGLLRYWPTDEQGIFLRGGTTRFLAGAGIDYRHPVMPQWDVMAALRYDFHKFTTEELQARGFNQSQGVQRIAATIGLARGRR